MSWWLQRELLMKRPSGSRTFRLLPGNWPISLRPLGRGKTGRQMTRTARAVWRETVTYGFCGSPGLRCPGHPTDGEIEYAQPPLQAKLAWFDFIAVDYMITEITLAVTELPTMTT